MATEQTLPKHVAIIMDGNGRWGEQQGKRRNFGHRAGAKKVREVLKFLHEKEVPNVSLYAFSSENWNRPRWEVQVLMRLLQQFSQTEIDNFIKNEIRVRFIGRRDRLDSSLLSAMTNLEEVTAGGGKMLLQVAVDYGGRDELVRAMNEAIRAGQELTEGELSQLLDTRLAPDPDLVIRTGGQQRSSNFMPWQTAYTEWQYTDTLWPDFSLDELELMLDIYMGIERRYGSVPTAAE